MDEARQRYLARHRRYNRSEKGRARWRRYYDRRMEDFEFRALEGMRKRAHHAATRQAAREEAGTSRTRRSSPLSISSFWRSGNVQECLDLTEHPGRTSSKADGVQSCVAQVACLRDPLQGQ